MNAAELAIHQSNTKAYIWYKPTLVILTPTKKDRTASGGHKFTDQPDREPQTVRIIESSLGTGNVPELRLQDGTVREQSFQMLGEHDAVFAIGDHWTTPDGRQWEIGDVVRPNGYEQRALVAERG